MGQQEIENTIADKLHLAPPPKLLLSPYAGAAMSLLRIQSGENEIGLTAPLPPEDTFVFNLHLIEAPRTQLWSGTTPFMLEAVAPGYVSMINLLCKPSAYIPYACDVLLFCLPRPLFNAFSDDVGFPRIGELIVPPHKAMDDQVLMHLGSLLLPAFQHSDHMNKLFQDYIALALVTHLARVYGGLEGPAKSVFGGLAPWQERRAKELMESRLSESISLAEIAGQCELSTSHFSRAFKQTTGQPPHRWLFERRIERAKDLLLHSAQGLADIAIGCGFADQSHFTRAFSRRVGATPGIWRRARIGSK